MICLVSGSFLLSLSCLPHGPHKAPAERIHKKVEPPLEKFWEEVKSQTDEGAANKSKGCLECHTMKDEEGEAGTMIDRWSMHYSATVKIGCTDCHGGNAQATTRKDAHVEPNDHHLFATSGNPSGNPAALNREPWEFVRFINPGDLRVADISCGACHQEVVSKVKKSMMTHGAMLWNAALYNNGSFPHKTGRFGESYSREGLPQRIQAVPPPTAEQTRTKGILPYLNPLPRFEIGQPANILRVFERGGRRPNPQSAGLAEINQPIPPNQDDEPGRPEQNRLSNRGYGTNNRTDPVWLNLHKTRLLDPTLNHLGTNDRAGEYRSSGCSACHVLYANDSDATHSAYISQFGQKGETRTTDDVVTQMIKKRSESNGHHNGHDQLEGGHPIKHVFTNAIPSSQCIVCHIHPGTNVVNSYLGYTWWDNESHADLLYPKQELKEDSKGTREITRVSSNPELSASRGKWGDPEFLEKATDLNEKMKGRLNPMKFAEFKGHGWLFRAVFKKDRYGNLLDADDNKISADDTDKLAKAVHLKDIHLEKGMHCIDCHFEQDNHGDGNLYGEVRNAIEMDCIDCHGSASRKATVKTSGPAAAGGGRDFSGLKTPFGKRRFTWRGSSLYQRSMVDPELDWKVVQTLDTVTPGHDDYNQASALAKTMQRDGDKWGDPTVDKAQLAHSNDSMTCFSCHSSWVTSCYGCHLPMKANRRRESLHYESNTTRNWTGYAFMTLRDDVFMLGKDGTVSGGRTSPARSSCAIIVGSQSGNREWLYSQQQTVSSEGFSGHAFATCVPHTVRAKETKTCTDCHVSAEGDNNAVMAQLLMQGTNAVNFMGRFIYVGTGKGGLEAVVVSERDEPQAVFGSTFHKHAYPQRYADHLANGSILKESYRHGAGGPLAFLKKGEIRSLQHRGEYVYLASGSRGMQIFDIANIDNKSFSQRITTAPVSPLAGQKLWVGSKDAAWVASPSTLAVDPTRERFAANQEGPIHPLYGYLYVADRKEGLIIVGAATLLDGNPLNNFVKRALTFNPDGKLSGARFVTIAGTFAYVLTDSSLVVVNLDDPLKPQITAEVGGPVLNRPLAVAIQFRYAFVADADGLKVFEVNGLARPQPIPVASLALQGGALSIYLSRTYAYVAAGSRGFAIIDIERPEKPSLLQMFNGDGKLNDTRDVKVGITNNSFFAYVADGRNGLRVVQLTSPDTTPGNGGYSPRPTPRLIATYPTKGPAIAISEGVDRDRAVDESGNQISVFSRVGSRPFNLAEMQRMYLRDGKVYTVTNSAPSEALKFEIKQEEKKEKKKGRKKRPRRKKKK